MDDPLPRPDLILAEVLRLPLEERAAYILRACGEDVLLRERVELLVAAHVPRPNLPGQTTLSAPGDTIVLQLPVEEQSGDRIGRYKLLEKIGEGGMGTVWRAEQIEPVRREVALKLIKTGTESSHVLARLEAERQALALMDHPNIAKVFDAGATPRARPFFIMELVKGVPITRFCDERQLPIRERLELFVPVCQAIQHAHQKGIIHRDLKPSNVMVALYDGRPVPKVIDFGVAKATGQRLTDRTLFTEFGAIIGTLEYMSPEQAELNQLDIDTRSDIYSLGVLLYELLTGTTPLTREAIRQGALDELLRRIREEEPPKPSTRLSQSKDRLPSLSAQRKLEPDKLRRLVSGDLDWIAMKALEKDRARRYETANGLARDVQRYLQNEPVLARSPSASYRFRKTIQRHKLAVSAAGAVTASLVAGLTIASWQYARASRLLVNETQARQRADNEAEKSKQVAEALNNLSLVIFDRARPFDPQPEKNLLDEAEQLQRLALETVRRLRGDRDPLVASSLNNLATMLSARGNLQEAERMQREELALSRSLDPNDPGIAVSLNNLALLLRDENKPADAESSAREALEMRRKILHDPNPDLAVSLNTLARILADEGKFEEAESLDHETVAMQKKLHDGKGSEVAESLSNLGTVLERRGKLTEAATALHEALVLRKDIKNEESEKATVLFNLATVLWKAGKLEDAAALSQECLGIRQSKTPDDWRTFKAKTLLGRVLASQKKWAETEPLLLSGYEGMKQREQQIPAENKDSLTEAAQSLFQFYEATGQIDKAAQWKQIAADTQNPRSVQETTIPKP